ncbi:hypothetical protein VT84_11960 [Gemmata sp. SH-PL17]|uniref:hypothetical protein n=1 Tax=Gemmata sp. SH-PL17 TaxID=1630693 RepID=UPI00078D13B5|nr:hypothetical protein [Gemmata sp. SH-PL17]AMV25104.1 hypothetical protein VT84_11960 [Gemmata sp. SH-PL17]
MTETEWLACEDLSRMTEQLEALTRAPRPGRRAPTSHQNLLQWNRKSYLHAAACWRRIFHLIEAPGREAVEAYERLIEGHGTWEEVGAARQRVITACACDEENPCCQAIINCAAASEAVGCAAAGRTRPPDFDPFGEDSDRSRVENFAYHGARAAEEAAQCALFREVFGNPFRSVTFSPVWRTSTAVALAQQMYESREFGAMPILGDALQDAGCDNTDVLNHCRAPGVHVRGCWVVDLVLDKG